MKYLMQIYGSGEEYASSEPGCGGTEMIFDDLDKLKSLMDPLIENGAFVVVSEWHGSRKI